MPHNIGSSGFMNQIVVVFDTVIGWLIFDIWNYAKGIMLVSPIIIIIIIIIFTY